MRTKYRIVREASAKNAKRVEAEIVVKSSRRQVIKPSLTGADIKVAVIHTDQRGKKLGRLVVVDRMGKKSWPDRLAKGKIPHPGATKHTPLELIVSQIIDRIPGLNTQQAHRLGQDLINTRLSAQALGPALTKLDTAATPATARALQATENVWRDLDRRYKLLTSTEVAELLGAKEANRAYASNLRGKGQILGVQRRNSYVYPGFQFDSRTHRVKPAIPLILALATELNWDTDDLTIWLGTPSGYYGGDRPADYLDNVDELLRKARDEATMQW